MVPELTGQHPRIEQLDYFPCLCQLVRSGSCWSDAPLAVVVDLRAHGYEAAINEAITLYERSVCRSFSGNFRPPRRRRSRQPRLGRLDSVEKDCDNWDRIGIGSELCRVGTLSELGELSSELHSSFCLSLSRLVSFCLTLIVGAVRCPAVRVAVPAT
jgi:hypothetical protein